MQDIPSPSRSDLSRKFLRLIKDELSPYVSNTEWIEDFEGRPGILLVTKDIDFSLHRYITETTRNLIQEYFEHPFAIDLIIVPLQKRIQASSLSLFSLTYDSLTNSFVLKYYGPERRRSDPFVVTVYYRKLLDALRLIEVESPEVTWKRLFQPSYESIAKQKGIITFTQENLAELFQDFLLQNYKALQKIANSKGDILGDLATEKYKGERELDFYRTGAIKRGKGFTVLSEQPPAVLIGPPVIDDSIDANYYHPAFMRLEQKLNLQKWELSSLRTITTSFINGPDYRSFSEEGTPYLRVGDIQPNWVELSQSVRVPIDPNTLGERFHLKPGDLMITRKGTFGICAVWRFENVPVIFSSEIIRVPIKKKKEWYSEFISTFLNSLWGRFQFDRYATGTIMKGINHENLAKVNIPKVDKPIQEFISAKVRLSEQCRLRAQRENDNGSVALSQYLNLPLLNNKVHDLAWWVDLRERDVDWLTPKSHRPEFIVAQFNLQEFGNVLQLGDLISDNDISGGATPLGAKYVSKGIPFLRVQNIERSFINLNGVVYVSSKTNKAMRRSQVKPYDLIITITGYPGNAAVATPDILPLNMNQHSVRMQLIELVDPFYVAAFLNSEYGIAQVQQWSSGATRDALSYESVKSILIPIIPIEQQRLIGNHYRRYVILRRRSLQLVAQAKSDVESLIEGRLDVDAILNGQILAPTWENVLREVEASLAI